MLSLSSRVSVRIIVPLDGVSGRVVRVDATEFAVRQMPESAEECGNDCLGAPLGKRRYRARLFL